MRVSLGPRRTTVQYLSEQVHIRAFLPILQLTTVRPPEPLVRPVQPKKLAGSPIRADARPARGELPGEPPTPLATLWPMDWREIPYEIWRRSVEVQPTPDWQIIAALGVVALVVAASPLWPMVRMLATITHEGGHALIALLTGRRLTGIKLNRDTSGVTLSRGRPGGAGMVATLLAGYPAPALTGLAAALLLGSGRAVGMLWLAVLLLGVLLLLMRNLYGIVVVVGLGAAVAALTWTLPEVWLSWIAYGVCWVLLWSAPRPIIELARHPERGSDVDQLARLTRVPRILWLSLFGVVTVAAVGLGVWLLLPLEQFLG